MGKTYDSGNQTVQALAKLIREQVPDNEPRHRMLNMLSVIGSCMLLIDGERQDAVDELAEARETFAETLRGLDGKL